jgi:nuclear GTP-binding protein
MIPGSDGQVAPGAETTGQAQIVSTLGVPFVLEGLFGEADAEAMDAEPEPEPVADAMGMDVENDAEGAAGATGATAADGGMIIDDDTAQNINTLCVFHPSLSRLETVKKVYRTVVWTTSPT